MTEQRPSKELSPCPFCGGTNLKVFGNAVQCMDVLCSAAGPDLGHCIDEPEAIRLWNKRAAHEPESAPIAYMLRRKSDGLDFGLFMPAEISEQDRDTYYFTPLYTRAAQPPGADHAG